MNEEADMVNNVMHSLHIPENLQNRVIDYYDHMIASMFVKNGEMYNLLSTSMADFIKLYQIRMSVHELSFINDKNARQIENFVTNIRIMFGLPGDVIIKQGQNNSRLFYIHEGMVEVGQHKEDLEYWIDPANINPINQSIRNSVAQPNSNSKLDIEGIFGDDSGSEKNANQVVKNDSPFLKNTKKNDSSLKVNKSSKRYSENIILVLKS